MSNIAFIPLLFTQVSVLFTLIKIIKNAQNLNYFHTVFTAVFFSYINQTLHSVRFFSTAIPLSSAKFTVFKALRFKKESMLQIFKQSEQHQILLVKYSNSQLTLIAWPLIEKRIEKKPNQKGNPLNPMCPLDSWNPPKQCFQDRHQFMYISNFMTLTDIYFCILSIKKLQTNGRFAGSFIYALYVLMLSQTNYLQFSESSFAPGLHVMLFFVSVLDSAIIDEKFQLACE